LNLNSILGLKSAVKIRGESANYIGARSVTAAIKPDIKLQPTRHVKTMDALQTGCVHINYYDQVDSARSQLYQEYFG
ncbi:hypothetical protein, partial [Shigella sonnei]